MAKHPTLTVDGLIEELEHLKETGLASGDYPVYLSSMIYTEPLKLRIEAISPAKSAVSCNPERFGPYVRIWGVDYG